MAEGELNQVAQLFLLFEWKRLLAVFVGFFILTVLVKGVKDSCIYLQNKWPGKRHLLLQIATTLNFFIYIVLGGLLIYGILNPPKELMIAIGGSVAVAIGFSLKDLAASVISGVILLFDRPFQVGDRVSFGGVYGEIWEIGLRTVKLNTLDDNLVTIPNSRFLSEIVSSGNAGALSMMITVPIHVDLNADLEKTKNIIYEVIATSRYAYLNQNISTICEETIISNRVCIKITAKAYVLDCKFEKEFQSDIVQRVNKSLREAGISRPSNEITG